jgi:hypothetical protein
MKKIVFISLLLGFSFLVFSSCKWEKNVTVHGIEFKKMRYLVQAKDTTGIYGILKQKSIIDGFPCAADWVELSREGELRNFCLSEDFTVANVHLQKGTWVFMKKAGKLLCVLPENTEYQGYICKGGGGRKGIHTTFYPSGKLRSFYPLKDVTINGIRCKASIFNNVALYENGHLKYCKLSKESIINGKKYPQNFVLNLDENGKVIE